MKPEWFSKAVAAGLAGLIVIIWLLPLSGCGGSPGPYKIGVLMPLTGPDAMETDVVLDWAAQTLNSRGGIGGGEVELVYRDTYDQNITSPARELLNDPEIRIVIGPQRSADVFKLAPLFIEKQKLLISPTATAAEITRAFGKQDYFWRTVQPDVAQIRCIMAELASRQVKKAALVYIDNAYGRTFYQWAGFFALELGIELTDIAAYTAYGGLEPAVEQVLSGAPEYVIAASYAEETVQIKRLVQERSPVTRLFFTDAAETGYVIEELGDLAEGLELMTPAADPNSGFEEDFKQAFGYYPYDYAAAQYDAFILAVGVLSRQQSLEGWWPFRHRETLPQSLRYVTSGDGEKFTWDDLDKAVESILDSGSPDIVGAAGPLEFDLEYGVDPIETFYSLNVVRTQDGVRDFRTERRFSSRESIDVGVLEEQSSAVFTRAGKDIDLMDPGTARELSPREDLWAVIVCSSSDWENYRHQSDALAVYDMLKRNGLPDENIIFLSEDDVPWAEQNNPKGDIHHLVDGSNIRNDAEIDYTGSAVNMDTLRNVLLGIESAETPNVLKSNDSANVFVYLVDHGSSGKMPFVHGDSLRAADLASILDEMGEKKMFRQMLVIVEACFGESIGMQIDTPGVLYLTGAARSEASFGATYDKKLDQWLADDFTRQLLLNMADPSLPLIDLYVKTYDEIIGSHVTLVNYRNFGDLTVPVGDFVSP